MQIELMVTLDLDDGERIYLLRTDRPYTRVPAAGEMVHLDDGDGTLGVTIALVSWSNEGVATLEFEEDASPSPTEEWLLACGYERIDAARFDDDDEQDGDEPLESGER